MGENVVMGSEDANNFLTAQIWGSLFGFGGVLFIYLFILIYFVANV